MRTVILSTLLLLGLSGVSAADFERIVVRQPDVPALRQLDAQWSEGSFDPGFVPRRV